MSQPAFRDGKAPFKIAARDEPCETYYKVYGDLNSGRTPVIVLHGGPGSGHEYVEPYSNLWTQYGIPAIFYDQIGCAASTHLRELKGDKTFWQPSLFAAELKNLLDYLQIGTVQGGAGFFLIGHSWGCLVAVNYVATYQPASLRKLVLASGNIDYTLFRNNLWELKKTFPVEHQQAIDKAVENGDFTEPAYLEALKFMRDTYLCRARPPPPEWLRDLEHQTEDSTSRQSMQGRSPFLFDGSLENHSSVPLLSKIKVPTLTFNGEFDTARDNAIQLYVDNIPNIRREKIAGGSHVAHLDSKELLQVVMKLVSEFLQ